MSPTTVTAVTERLPRFVRRPRDIPSFELTERDEEILKIIARHRFATSAQIISLIMALFPDASRQQVLRRLQYLFHAGHLSRPKAQVDTYKAGGGSRPIVYALGNRGIDHLAAIYGFRRASVDWTAKARTAVRGEIDHALEITEFMVELEIACHRRGTLQIIHLDEILATLAPEETRKSRRPYQWPVAVRWKGSDIVLHPTPDRIFGIRDLERSEGRNTKFLFLEADRGTMPTARRSLDKTSILRKIVGYAETYRRDLHTKRYGLPNVRVLTVTPGRQRIGNIIAAYREHANTLVSPKFFLFADRAGLSRADDWLDYPLVDAAGEQHRLLD
ncbi:MAG TPA: replication-relaxation family protein [Stellaceae bacterium]|nr:replication-relaxation family protein [Stellaceae bacterium]